MSTLGHPGIFLRHHGWRKLLILFAVLCLTISLAARYATTCDVNIGVPTISGDSASARTQHLLSDGLQWTAPTAAIIMLIVPRRAARIVPIALPVSDLYSENWLYNRPPPSR